MFSFFSKQDHARIKSFEQFCFNQGMSFSEKDDLGLKSLVNIFSLFGKYRNGIINHIASRKSGDLSEQEYLFDYTYKVSTGKSTITYRQTVYFVNSKLLALPEFMMKPEHFGHKIASYLGINDIDFEEYPVFSDKYHLKGEHESYIRSTFSDHILKFFSKHHGWNCEAANYFMIFYKFNSLAHGPEINQFYTVSRGVYDLFKDASSVHLDVGLPE